MGLNDKIEKVIVASLNTLEVLSAQVELKQEQLSKNEIPIHLDNTLLLLMEKAGDSMPRVKEETERVILRLADSPTIGTIPVINHLIRVKKVYISRVSLPNQSYSSRRDMYRLDWS